MSDVTNPQAADPTATATSTAAAIPAGQPVLDWESDANPWKKRAQGWQGKYQETDNLRKGIEAQLSDVSAKLTDAEKIAKEKADEASKYFTDLTAVRTEADEVKAKLERKTLIAEEFPALLDLEKDGVLPSLAGDQLRAALQKLNAKISTAANAKTRDVLEGASVPPPAAEKQQTADELKKSAMELVRQGKPQKDVDAAWDKYYAVMPSVQVG